MDIHYILYIMYNNILYIMYNMYIAPPNSISLFYLSICICLIFNLICVNFNQFERIEKRLVRF